MVWVSVIQNNHHPQAIVEKNARQEGSGEALHLAASRGHVNVVEVSRRHKVGL